LNQSGKFVHLTKTLKRKKNHHKCCLTKGGITPPLNKPLSISSVDRFCWQHSPSVPWLEAVLRLVSRRHHARSSSYGWKSYNAINSQSTKLQECARDLL